MYSFKHVEVDVLSCHVSLCQGSSKAVVKLVWGVGGRTVCGIMVPVVISSG